MEQNKKPLAYRLMRVNTEKFVFELPHEKFEIKSLELINYHVDPKVMFDVEGAFIIIKCIIKANVIETEEVVMEIETYFKFSVENLADYVVTKGNNTEFKDYKDNQFLGLLIGVAYSTMRGIILERLRGTFIESQFLPVINPMYFIKNKVEE